MIQSSCSKSFTYGQMNFNVGFISKKKKNGAYAYMPQYILTLKIFNTHYSYVFLIIISEKLCLEKFAQHLVEFFLILSSKVQFDEKGILRD